MGSFGRRLLICSTLCWFGNFICLPSGSAQSVKPDDRPIPSGLIFLDRNSYESIPAASSPTMGLLPQATDLSNKFPPPGDQGLQNSCAAWAVSYALKTYQEGQAKHWPIDSADHIFSPSFVYNQLNRTSDCKGGLTLVDVLNFVHEYGVASLKDFSYDVASCSKVPDNNTKQRAQSFVIGGYQRVNVQDDAEVKGQLTAGHPVLVGLEVDLPFYRLQGADTYAQFAGPPKANHALVIAGYDDQKQAYKVINSWGAAWGDHGVGWL